MLSVRVTSLNGTYIESIVCLTLYRAYVVRCKIVAMGLMARVFNVI